MLVTRREGARQECQGSPDIANRVVARKVETLGQDLKVLSLKAGHRLEELAKLLRCHRLLSEFREKVESHCGEQRFGCPEAGRGLHYVGGVQWIAHRRSLGVS